MKSRARKAGRERSAANAAQTEAFMEMAIKEAKASLRSGNKGFGAVLVADGVVIAKGHDTTRQTNDPTAHAEINVIRMATRGLGTPALRGCTLLSTHEPCPMCATACVWAGIERIVFGASIADTVKLGRKRVRIPAREVVAKGPVKIRVQGGILRDRCLELYR